MYARVATFDGGDPDVVRQGVEEIKRRASGGPPEGVPATGLLVLHEPESAKVLSITLFATEADRQQGDAGLNTMDPPVTGRTNRRVSVELYDVAVKIDV